MGPHSFSAVYFDGQTPDKHEIVVEVVEDGLLLNWPDGAEDFWPYEDILPQKPTSRTEPIHMERGPAPNEVLVIEDHYVIRSINEIAPGAASQFKFGIQESKRVAKLAAVGLVALLFGGFLYTVGIPAIAEKVAENVPREWEEQLGSSAILGLTNGTMACADSSLNEAVIQMVAQLTAEVTDSFNWNVSIVSIDMVNAFAAPGGYIVVFSGLIDATETPEELAGVLAHEIQHVVQHHGTKAMVRQIPLRLIMSAMLGDASLAGGAAQAIGAMGMLKYQREDEEEADSTGVELMFRAGLDPGGMSGIFETLAEDAMDVPGFLRYMSTHPNTEERIDRINHLISLNPEFRPQPLLPGVDWEELKYACSDFEEEDDYLRKKARKVTK